MTSMEVFQAVAAGTLSAREGAAILCQPKHWFRHPLLKAIAEHLHSSSKLTPFTCETCHGRGIVFGLGLVGWVKCPTCNREEESGP